jgi:hypothetical protein
LFDEAVKRDCRTLALPSFGTGAYGVPLEAGAAIACEALADALVNGWGGASTRLRIVRFWLASQETMDAYAAAIDRGPPRLRPVRWEDRPFAETANEPTTQTRPVEWHAVLDADDFALLRAGLHALEMEEKWWAFWNGSHLRIFRSWTGYEIFSLRTRPRADGQPGAVLDRLHICDDRARYNAEDAAALAEFDAVLSAILRR